MSTNCTAKMQHIFCSNTQKHYVQIYQKHKGTYSVAQGIEKDEIYQCVQIEVPELVEASNIGALHPQLFQEH